MHKVPSGGFGCRHGALGSMEVPASTRLYLESKITVTAPNSERQDLLGMKADNIYVNVTR